MTEAIFLHVTNNQELTKGKISAQRQTSLNLIVVITELQAGLIPTPPITPPLAQPEFQPNK